MNSPYPAATERPAPPGRPRASRQARRAGIGSFVGTTIEWYDFFIYGTASALVFGKLFFPDVSPAAGVLASFATFWVGFLARPLGGIVFGHFGDRMGRKGTLVTTLLMMGIATFLVGVLPTHAQIGLAAPLLLALLRAVQGIAVGGEWGGAVLMASESAPKGRGSLFAMLVQQGSPAGSILGTLVFLAAGTLDDAAFLSWGWRVPFLLSGLLVVVGLLIRLKVEEPDDFERVKDRGEVAKLPVVEVLRTAWRVVLLGLGASIMGISAAYFTNTFVLSWTTNDLHMARQTMLYVLLGTSALQFLWQPFAALISERVGEMRFMVCSLLANVVLAFPAFHLISTTRPLLVFCGVALTIVSGSGYYAVLAGFLARAFPSRVRYTGISLSYQLCSTLIGGTTPLACQALLTAGGSIWPVVGFYVLLLLVTAACVAALARSTERRATAPEPVPTTA
ncbi:MFS transporter [Streptomyces cacaoi]|uniref:MFS transporter n=1 Tax=Streptomyces cacaoi TaxID=1898 RepID=A0A4Y3QW44_STRCI|nr:MFS transporter [Streptomyces cacaoi]NNG83476.1 MHS family MFS transporter [Streptomyces cacaoi]GEB49179.1 MFS transporter [Streptomyces cacaoi]